jgi:HK97 family phage portal protein
MEILGAWPLPLTSVVINATTAMRCTAVRRAVQAIAEPIGQLPLHVYRRDGDARERDRDHPVAKVLRDPNEWTSSSDFREQMQRDCLLWGNAYAYINRVDGKPRELIRLDPAQVDVVVKDGEPAYRTKGTPQLTYSHRDVLHIKAPSTDSVTGRSIVTDCREAIATALILEEHAARLFSNGARPGGVIEFPNQLGDEGLKKMRAAWRGAHEGSANAGKTAILWGGAKFNPTTMSSTDAQFLELRRYAVDEIARAFGVPPHLLFEMGRATWGNSAELGSTFVTFTLMRWVKVWQGEIRLKLFEPDERDDFYSEFLVDDLLKADIAVCAMAYSQLIAARVLNANEARARENLPPYAGGDTFENPHTATGTNPNGEAA